MNRIEFANHVMILADDSMDQTVKLAARAAVSNAPVLIYGESGTGKELIARYIHEKGPRKDRGFVSVNCAAIPDGLLESELFGYERGAFTGAVSSRMGKFEQASRGTLLLDEISEMPLGLQAKLLRALQEKEIDRLGSSSAPISIDTRVLSTTNKQPQKLVKSGEFRKDLFYRINVIEIHCLPLRGRMNAIDVLATQFVNMHAERGEKLILSKDAMCALRSHDWPGNIRELQNVIQRAVWLSDGKKIEKQHLSFAELDSEEGNPNRTGIEPLESVEERHILKALELTKGNRNQAAESLGISVRTLRNKLKLYQGVGS